MLFCGFEAFVVAMIMALAAWLFDTLRPWTIIGGNLVATLIMLAVLFRDHSLSLGELMTSAE
jgi:CBS-domain-containing membrane protein